MNRLFKLLVLLLFFSNNILAQCPPNIGFEDGTFTNWQCYAGQITQGGVIDVGETGPMYDRHTILSGGGLDHYGGFPVVCPNGSKFSVKLGNADTGRMAERISYTYTVPPGAEHSLVLNYAVVLQNPEHAAIEQPKFTVTVFNVTDGVKVACPEFNFVASSSLPGFKLSDVAPLTGNSRGPSSIYYKDWSATTINLVGYAGKVIRLEFTTNDCTRGGHFGYAYLDLNEECKQPITGNTYCAGQPSITLHAPRGFLGYKWYNENQTVLLGTGQSLKIDPAPPDQTKYVLEIEAFPGLGCADILHTVITRLPNEFTFKTEPVIWACPGTGADLTALSVTAGSTAGLTFSYYTNPDSLTYLRDPQAVTKPGTYYIQALSPEGCTNILPIQVKLRDTAAIVTKDPPPAQYPSSVDLALVYTAKSDQTYIYYSEKDGSTPILDHKARVSGKYAIKAINQWGCETVAYVKVTINPPPPYKITAPNAFTPNADGVNDNFMISIDGFVTFGDIKIFNRYGNQVFTSKALTEYWNGTFNGYLLPVGTYYWIFNGEDSFNHVPVIKSGSVAIVR
jgi:gliding motility-associated-like protein